MKSLTPLHFDEVPAAAQAEVAFPFSAFGAAADSSAPAQSNRLEQLEKMLREAQGRAEIVEKEAYDKAYLAGEKAGMALGKRRGEQILGALQETLQHADRQLQDIQQSFAEAAIDLAEFIASQIIGEALGDTPESLLAIANQAAARLPANGPLKIAVCPEDMATFQRLLEDESDPSENSASMLSADAAISPGTCRLISDTQDALIDPLAAVHHYIEELRPALLQPPSGRSGACADDPETPEPDADAQDARPPDDPLG
ncbi:MAG: FliH/SctL family protein [Mariprofundaceae bacterium]